MLDFDIAQARLAEVGQRPESSNDCVLEHALGRVLAQDVVAKHDLPPSDNSAMDGYAIRHADYAPGKPMPVQQRNFAGQAPDALQPGNTIRLFTGSVIPQGADTVIMQEDCTETDNTLLINEAPVLGRHIRKQGEDVRKDTTILQAGVLIGAAQIALLASQGYTSVAVHPKIRIGILSTGDELIEPGQPLGPAQIYNSNGAMLAAQVKDLGAEVVHTVHALDTTESLQQAFGTLLRDCDLVLTVGGVSVGEKDLVKPTIESLGGTLDLWRVCMKPGKPVALAYANGKPIVCLPGNPVSAFAVFTLLVSPLIRRMQGRTELLPLVRYGRLQTNARFHETREEFIRVKATHEPDGTTALHPFGNQGSGVISSLPWSTGMARIPKNTVVSQGDVVAYYSWAEWLR